MKKIFLVLLLLLTPLPGKAEFQMPILPYTFDCNQSGQYICKIYTHVSYMETSVGLMAGTFELIVNGPEGVSVQIRSSNGYGDDIVASCERYARQAEGGSDYFKIELTWSAKPANAPLSGGKSLYAGLIQNHPDTPIKVKCSI